MAASRARSGIRRSSCFDSGSSASPAATPIATTPRGWPTTPSTSSWSSAIRSRARPWPRSPRSRASRMPWGRGLLRRLLGKLRAAFPTAPLRVRLDGGFATPALFAFLEAQPVEYLVAMASNGRLEKRARRLMGRARMLSRTSGRTEHLYGETRYAARKWPRKRRVIIKAEVVRHPGRAPKNNPRFVVTNLPDAPETVYRIYCQRGDMENRLKELHHGLELDRTSCSRFLANQFRGLLTLAAYVLFQELQRRAQGTACADAQVTTLRARLLKLAVWVERSVRRIVLHLPMTCPWLRTWRQLARAVGATS